jgi:hypothetical protein
MRFRLRTLLILIVFAGLVFARMGHFRQKAIAHRHAAANLVPVIATAEKENTRNIESSVQHLASGSATLKTIIARVQFREVIVLENGAGNGLVIQNNAALSNWRDAVRHSALAAQYERAVYRPWMIVSESAVRP